MILRKYFDDVFGSDADGWLTNNNLTIDSCVSEISEKLEIDYQTLYSFTPDEIDFDFMARELRNEWMGGSESFRESREKLCKRNPLLKSGYGIDYNAMSLHEIASDCRKFQQNELGKLTGGMREITRPNRTKKRLFMFEFEYEMYVYVDETEIKPLDKYMRETGVVLNDYKCLDSFEFDDFCLDFFRDLSNSKISEWKKEADIFDAEIEKLALEMQVLKNRKMNLENRMSSISP